MNPLVILGIAVVAYLIYQNQQASTASVTSSSVAPQPSDATGWDTYCLEQGMVADLSNKRNYAYNTAANPCSPCPSGYTANGMAMGQGQGVWTSQCIPSGTGGASPFNF